MNRHLILATGVAALILCGARAAYAECKLQLVAALPISFVNNEPMVEASINGKTAHLRLSLGEQTIFWGNLLKEYGLKEESNSSLGTAYGVGGQTADVTAVQIHEFKAGNLLQKDQYYFIMYRLKKVDEVGYFGLNQYFGKYDIEFDFAHSAVRVFDPKDCKDDDVVHWAGNYSVAEQDKDGYYAFQIGDKTLRGALGAGNEVTFVTPEGARQAGVDSKAAGPLPMGMVADGLIKPIDVSIAVFPELVVGDETIKNLPLAVADIFPDKRSARLPQVVLGGDFLRSHRVYLSKQQKKIYFSYVGGLIFQDIYKRLGAEPTPAPPRAPGP